MTRPTPGLTRVEITRRVISASRIHTGAASPRTAAAYASIFQREREGEERRCVVRHVRAISSLLILFSTGLTPSFLFSTFLEQSSLLSSARSAAIASRRNCEPLVAAWRTRLVSRFSSRVLYNDGLLPSCRITVAKREGEESGGPGGFSGKRG